MLMKECAMGHVENTLAPEEEYLYRAKFNWTCDVAGWGWLFLGSTPAVFWSYQFLKNYLQLDILDNTFTYFAGISFVLGAIILLKRYIHKWTTVIALTAGRLVLKTRLIARDAHEVSLDKIEEVLVHHSFLGRVLGYGVLTARGTGMALIEYPVLARPMEIRREIQTAMVQSRGARKSSAHNQSQLRKGEYEPLAAVVSASS